MLRLTTYVTTSPLTLERTSSAASQTAPKSLPRAREKTHDRSLVERVAGDGSAQSTGQLVVARQRSMPQLDEPQVVLRRRHCCTRRPPVDAGESFGVDPTEHRRSYCLIQPSLPLQRVPGIDGEALDQQLAGRLGLSR